MKPPRKLTAGSRLRAASTLAPVMIENCGNSSHTSGAVGRSWCHCRERRGAGGDRGERSKSAVQWSPGNDRRRENLGRSRCWPAAVGFRRVRIRPGGSARLPRRRAGRVPEPASGVRRRRGADHGAHCVKCHAPPEGRGVSVPDVRADCALRRRHQSSAPALRDAAAARAPLSPDERQALFGWILAGRSTTERPAQSHRTRRDAVAASRDRALEVAEHGEPGPLTPNATLVPSGERSRLRTAQLSRICLRWTGGPSVTMSMP